MALLLMTVIFLTVLSFLVISVLGIRKEEKYTQTKEKVTNLLDRLEDDLKLHSQDGYWSIDGNTFNGVKTGQQMVKEILADLKKNREEL